MTPKYHVLFGLIFILILYLAFSPTTFILAVIFFSSILIDVDHYILYFFAKKDLSLRKAYKFFIERKELWLSMPLEKREKCKRAVFYFHGIEFLAFILLLSFFSSFFIPVFLGCLFHLFIDLIELYFYKEPLYCKISQIYVYITNKNKKQLKYN